MIKDQNQRNRKPSSVMTRPLSSNQSFIDAQKIAAPPRATPVQAAVYLKCGYIDYIPCVPSLCLPHCFLRLPLSLCLLSIFAAHLSRLPTMPRRQRLCELLSEKMTLLLQTNSSCFGSSCCILFREGRRKSGCWLLALKNAPPLRIQGRVRHQTAGPNGTARLMQS